MCKLKRIKAFMERVRSDWRERWQLIRAIWGKPRLERVGKKKLLVFDSEKPSIIERIFMTALLSFNFISLSNILIALANTKNKKNDNDGSTIIDFYVVGWLVGLFVFVSLFCRLSCVGIIIICLLAAY